MTSVLPVADAPENVLELDALELDALERGALELDIFEFDVFEARAGFGFSLTSLLLSTLLFSTLGFARSFAAVFFTLAAAFVTFLPGPSSGTVLRLGMVSKPKN
jgi:hypothetical protein